MTDPICRECNAEPCVCVGVTAPTQPMTIEETLAKQSRAMMYWHERALAAEKDFAAERAARERAELDLKRALSQFDDALGRLQSAEAARDALAHEVTTVRAEINARYAVEQKDVWHWHGDGSDHPESISNGCHVVMSGSQLRDILADCDAIAARLAEAEKDARRYVEWRRAFREGECSLWNALCECQTDEDHDAAIDAALARTEPQS